MSFFDLPSKIEGYKIRSDYRVVLEIFDVFLENKNEYKGLDNYEKFIIAKEMLFYDENVPLTEEIYIKMYMYFEGMDLDEEFNESCSKNKMEQLSLFCWQQDKCYIFGALMDKLGYDVRQVKYMHWYSFISAFMTMGENVFTNIVNMRLKKAKNKLSKEEKREWKEAKEIYELKKDKKLNAKEIEKQEKIINDFLNN